MLIVYSNIFLKLENIQPSGSFKSRGVGNFLLAHLPSRSSQVCNGESDTNTYYSNEGFGAKDNIPNSTHFFCSSGGNAGLGCVHAAVTLGCPATIVVPLSTMDYVIAKMTDAGAKQVIQRGDSWAEADQYLKEEVLAEARRSGEHAVYVPPFDAQDIWDGNATLVDEMMQQLRDVDHHYPVTSATSAARGVGEDFNPPDAIICSVGGGGLFSGIMQGLNAHGAANTRVITVETAGADSLAQSVAAGKLVTLPAITSIATTLGARTVCKKAFEYAMERDRVTNAVLSDAEAVHACRRFANEERILVEPACGVSLALCYSGKLREYFPDLQPSSRVIIVVCGGSSMSLDIMAKYVKEFCD